MKEIGSKIKCTDLAYTIILKGILTTENGAKTNKMEEEFFNSLMEQNMKDNGRII